MRYLKYFPRYTEEVGRKMQKGFRDHGDKSFDRPLLEIVRELQEEADDLGGWGCVLWGILDELKGRIIFLTEEVAALEKRRDELKAEVGNDNSTDGKVNGSTTR